MNRTRKTKYGALPAYRRTKGMGRKPMSKPVLVLVVILGLLAVFAAVYFIFGFTFLGF